MATLTVYPSYDSEVGGSDAAYATAHDESGDWTDDTTDYYTLGQWLSGGVYYLYRWGLIFDLSSLSASAISSATLTMTVYWDKTSGNEWDVTIVDGSDFQNPAVAADYGELLNETISWGERNTADATDDEPLVITINATGLAAILAAQGGDFKIGLRSSEDISPTEPGGEETYWMYSRNSGTQSNRPTLTIEYTPAFIPQVIIID